MDLERFFAIHHSSLEDIPASQRYLYKQIDWSQQAICIWGARGVGKTTL